MPLPLPPRFLIRCDGPTAQSVHELLTSVIAGHAMARTTYQFYEELDAWLGPWGDEGYPIAYGKFYNIAFSTNAKLRHNPRAREWVWRTTILLQEALRDYVVGRVRDGTLPGLTESQLRAAAFDSHPGAYDQGGLAMVMMVAPELIPVIATIPYREFSPTSRNFNSTIEQVFATIGKVSPELVGIGLAVMAGPAHTGILRRAIEQDRQRFLDEMALSRELGTIRRAIESGEADYIPVLDMIIGRLSARQYPNQGFAQAAGEVVESARARRAVVLKSTQSLLNHSPEVRSRVEALYPNTFH
ncbi:MAG: hypothetical protein U0800_21295 [Isosphaeraceae bacterium]